MSDKQQAKPLNITERRSTIQEFEEYCAAKKESQRNSGDSFDEDAFDQAVDIALQKLTNLHKEGWT